MLIFADSKIEAISIHQVGNKFRDEFYQLSDSPLDLSAQDEDTKLCLMNFFCGPFHKPPLTYRFFHPNAALELNEANHYVSAFFDGKTSFQETSENLVKYLYEVSCHPKISAGEFYTVHFSGVIFEGEYWDAIGVYKVDNKELFLDVNQRNGSYHLNIIRAIGLGKLEKAAIILNSEKQFGFKVIVADLAKSLDSNYWKDEFLQVRLRNDAYLQSLITMDTFETFVKQKLDETFEVEKIDKVDLLNKGMAYFKENDTFDQADFAENIFQNPDVIEKYRSFSKDIQEDRDVQVPDSFNISEAALKKKKSAFKSVIKLDKNAHIYLHGKRDFIEKGFDEHKGMNYYKIYFENES